jgi:hypothetical protein
MHRHRVPFDETLAPDAFRFTIREDIDTVRSFKTAPERKGHLSTGPIALKEAVG